MIKDFKCLCCNSDDLFYYIDYNTIRLGDNKVIKCDKCSFKFILPRNLDPLDNWEQQKESRKKIVNDTKDRIDVTLKNGYRYLKHLENNITDIKEIKHLDVGSGYSYGSLLFKNKKNTELTLLEASGTIKKGIDLVNQKENIPKNNFKDITIIENISFEDYKSENKFSVITLWHVLEHVNNPISFLNKIYDLLDFNGIFLLEIPNDDDELNKIKEYRDIVHFTAHLNYFNKKTISLFINKTKFKNSKIEIKGVQRYGFYNYIDWIRYNKKSFVKDDDYCNYGRSKIEEYWLKNKTDNLICDTLFIKIIK